MKNEYCLITNSTW